ncbi:hypothetical protein DFJ74DRAFT_701073 [Hyaloraphidium curvatum]|nr:hypothetical protein DFJ74DRAFT_701073 [Hyaloraphidium curvatum]
MRTAALLAALLSVFCLLPAAHAQCTVTVCATGSCAPCTTGCIAEGVCADPFFCAPPSPPPPPDGEPCGAGLPLCKAGCCIVPPGETMGECSAEGCPQCAPESCAGCCLDGDCVDAKWCSDLEPWLLSFQTPGAANYAAWAPSQRAVAVAQVTNGEGTNQEQPITVSILGFLDDMPETTLDGVTRYLEVWWAAANVMDAQLAPLPVYVIPNGFADYGAVLAAMFGGDLD